MPIKRKQAAVVLNPDVKHQDYNYDSSHKVESDSLIIERVGTLEPGTIFSIKNEHGRFKFVQHVVNTQLDVEWIECYGGIKSHEQFRAIRPDRVRRIVKPKGT